MSEDDPPILCEPTSVNGAPLANIAETPTLISEATCSSEDTSSEANSDLCAAVNKLIQALGELKELQSMQTVKIRNLELELVGIFNQLPCFCFFCCTPLCYLVLNKLMGDVSIYEYYLSIGLLCSSLTFQEQMLLLDEYNEAFGVNLSRFHYIIFV